ncbi:MAG: DUF6879 family protein [Micromonosporaceae bacterium]
MHLAGEAWERFFDSFEHDAFRLETLPAYAVDNERAEFAHFLATGELNILDDDPWLRRIRRCRNTGRSIARVHVVEQPLTDYLRYEFAAYHRNVAAGEEVSILDLTGQPNPGLPRQDFWLFDESRVVLMDYDADGRQLVREFLGETDPTPYVRWKRLALERAEPFDAYCSRLEM